MPNLLQCSASSPGRTQSQRTAAAGNARGARWQRRRGWQRIPASQQGASWQRLWACGGRWLRGAVAGGVLAVAMTPALARDLIVDNVGGSDAQNDRGLVAAPPSFGPYRTVARAIKAAMPGDRIVLRKTDQPYRESFSLTGPNASGTETYPFVIVGNGAILDGSQPAEQPQWEPAGDGLFRYHPTPPGYGLLLLEDRRLTRVRFDGPARPSELPPMGWTRSLGRFYLRPEAGRMPSDYPIRVTQQTTGITLYDVRHVVIRDLTVRGFRLDGINAHDRATEVLLVNVQCEDNGRSGVSVGGASRVRIEGSRFMGNGEAQIRTEGLARLTLEQVQADPASAPLLERQSGTVVGQPLPIAPL